MTRVSQEELVKGVASGKVVSFPTDTVPALAVKPELAKLIFQLKQRPATKPLILMAASIEELLPYLDGSDAELANWLEIAQKYWPGALTLVLPASDSVSSTINPTDSKTIGIRIPHSAIALEILRQTGVLATTSANFSGKPPLETMEAIEHNFPEVLVLQDDGVKEDQPMGSGLPSTVVQWTEAGWQILRQGSIELFL
ncbi:SUA5/yciO/yrdC domain protein [Stanieria cyanosphaera PCC 7437]|uniref:L-threonylcarbamoyladenylate synthase n=1 Tax=Stanieria cyanosphaera (strain ATCC 29371 / PCC 7437) TaxID=111780 RepID=K9XXS2_STAC7|nr:L-threonylcarbamoyladenylate synthase [Stanieria cyanosphaera]AFZ37323.1 SUA5/yciO/yrdC domain protein [Stanieria cyanosphaera PCC 7437]